jgi:hypothetical protein
MKRASVIVILLTFISTARAGDSLEQKILSGEGLIGTYFNSDDFERPETRMIDLLTTIDCEWGDKRGSDWSARWFGFVKAPITGEVTFTAEVWDGIRLTIGNSVVVDSLQKGGIHIGVADITRGQKVPIQIEFVSSSEKALLRLYWQWLGKEKEIIPASVLSHRTDGLPKEFMVFDFDNRPSEQDNDDDDDDEQVVLPQTWDENTVPGSDELPLQYIGDPLPDKTASDGRLTYSPGVQNIQISRANRKHPPAFPPGTENETGWTYQHHVGIGQWKGKLYGVWDMTHVGEDNPPVRLVYATSNDGFNWTQPRDLYPFNKAYNSRFYFYHSSNDRMLVFASGWYPTDNVAEDRKDRLYVREITSGHKLGKIYTLIKPAPDHPPAYTESKDTGFLQACHEVLNNKPLLEQADYGILLGDKKMKWHEGKNWPGGKIPSIGGDLWIFGKSMCFYHRTDGVLVGTCKMGWVTQSRDEGETWSFPTIPRGIKGGGGKTWAQATPDGRYAMIYIPQDDDRYPMAITSSDDGVTFRDMRVIHGEIPPQRYEGRAKPLGPQYLRGLSEWGSDSSRDEKDCIWTIYSVSKEDIWVSRVPVPIVTEGKHADDDFDEIATGPRVPGWNTYSPTWAQVSIAAEGRNHYLQLEDGEPVDYARAIRTFPPSKAVTASFRVSAGQTDRGRFEIELLGELARRPVRIILNDYVTRADEWLDFKINADCATGKHTVVVNGREVLKDATFAESSSIVYALSFRTGRYRNKPGQRAKRDIPNTDEPLHKVMYRIDDVRTGKWLAY